MFKNSSISAMHNRKLLVVIGNGFDLDLELKTSYKDFMTSQIFDRYRANSHFGTPSYEKLNLFDYLLDRFDGNDKKWIDVEIELREFAKNVDLSEYGNEQKAINQKPWGQYLSHSSRHTQVPVPETIRAYLLSVFFKS